MKPAPASPAFRKGGRILTIAMAFAVLSAALMAMRIHFYAEFWIDRTYWLLALAAFGGFIGAGLVGLLYPALARRLTGLKLRSITAFSFCCFFMLGMGLLFVVYVRLIAGTAEIHPDFFWRSLISGTAQVFAAFLISSPTYLLPWMLPILALTAAFLIPQVEKPR